MSDDTNLLKFKPKKGAATRKLKNYLKELRESNPKRDYGKEARNKRYDRVKKQLEVEAAMAKADARNKSQINNRRVKAVKAVREKKMQDVIGQGADMIAVETKDPSKVIKVLKDTPTKEEVYNHKTPKKQDRVSSVVEENKLRSRAEVMESLGPRGAPSEVVRTNRRGYLVQEKAPLFKNTPDYSHDYVERALEYSADNKGIYLQDVHQDNVGDIGGRPVLRDAGHAEYTSPEKAKAARQSSRKLTVKKSLAGKIIRKLPMVGALATLATSDDASAALDPMGSEVMGQDRSIEDPRSVEFQKRVAAERLIQAIENRRKK